MSIRLLKGCHFILFDVKIPKITSSATKPHLSWDQTIESTWLACLQYFFYIRWEIDVLAEWVLASQGGFCSVELVGVTFNGNRNVREGDMCFMVCSFRAVCWQIFNGWINWIPREFGGHAIRSASAVKDGFTRYHCTGDPVAMCPSS